MSHLFYAINLYLSPRFQISETMGKEYKKDDATIIWDSSKCIHAAECVKGLPHVFQPKERPWINTENAGKDEIIATVSKCPSGALSIKA